MTLERLNALSFEELRSWLADALADQAILPRLTRDEPPDVAILAAEHVLDKPTRRDLQRGCRELVREFIRTGQGAPSYIRSLLNLAAGLDQRELAGELATFASQFHEKIDLDGTIKQAVLLTLIDLKELQPVDFWWSVFMQDPHAYAGASLSGLLANNWHSGLGLLVRFSDDPMLASVAAVILDQALEDLTPAQRSTCVSELERMAPRCSDALREALSEVIGEYSTPGARSPTHTPVVRILTRLNAELQRFLPGATTLVRQ